MTTDTGPTDHGSSDDTVLLTRRSDWTRSGTVSASGIAFDGNELLSGITLCERFEGISSLGSFTDLLADLNGFLAVVIERTDAVLLGVDHVRSIPLYYVSDSELVSDDPRWLRERLGDPANDPLAESELLAGGTVLDNRTLIPGLATVRPGEAVRLANGEARTSQHTDYRPTGESIATDPGRKRLEAAVDSAFDRFSTVVGDRQVAVSLSGGHDSRLIATELARRGHDVLAFSFGRPDCEDVAIAEDIAAALEVPWTFVEYSTDSWREWYRSPERVEYVEDAFGYDSIPNYGALPALSHLRETGMIEPDAVCTSGQTVVGMSEDVPRELTSSEPTQENLLAAILRYWRRWEWDNPAFEKTVRERIVADLSDDVDSPSTAFAAFERWKWADRHVKYFVAEVRQYDFLDLGWWLPLWDREIVTAWEQVPFAGRRGKQVYRDLVDRRFAEVAGIDVAEARGLTVQTSAPTAVGRFVDWIAERLVDSPIASLAAPVYWSLQRRRSAYGDHPLGWYGIVPPDLFATLYSGREDIHALQTLETVGRASFLEGTVTDPPHAGVLSLPYPDGE